MLFPETSSDLGKKTAKKFKQSLVKSLEFYIINNRGKHFPAVFKSIQFVSKIEDYHQTNNHLFLKVESEI